MLRRFLAGASALSLVAGLTLIASTPAFADEVDPVVPIESPVATDAAVDPGLPPAEEEGELDPDSTETTDPESTDPESTESESTESTESDTLDTPAARVMSFAAAAVRTVQQCAAPNPTTYVTPGSTAYAAMDFSESRSGGSHSLTSSGLEIAWAAVGGDKYYAKSAGYVPVSIPFVDAGTPALDITSTSGASAGLNVTVAHNGTKLGNLVFEPLFAKYWATFAVSGMPAGPNPGYQKAYGTLDEYLAAFDALAMDVEIIAIGYSGGSGSEGTAVVNSLTVGCDQFVFAAPPPPTNQACGVTTGIVVTSLSQLDLTSTRSLGHQALRSLGLRVWTEAAPAVPPAGPDQRKAAGYLDVPDFPLSQTGDLAVSWTASAPGQLAPGGQLVVDLDGDTSPDGILVFEPLAYGQQVWLTSVRPGFSTTGAPEAPGGGGPLNGSIDDYLVTWPDAQVLAVGYSLGSGVTSSGILTLLRAGCLNITFNAAASNQECTAYSSIVVTDLATLDLSQSRPLGHQELVDGGLHLVTDPAPAVPVSPDPRKAAGYLDVPDFPLTQTGTFALTWVTTAPGQLAPGGQLVVDLDGDTVADGILVFEPLAYGQEVWLASIRPGFATFGAPTVGGGGGPINGTIDQYLDNWPNAKGLAIGYSLGSGVTSDGVLTLLQAGCLQVTFDEPIELPTLPVDDGDGPDDQLETLAITGAQPGGALGLGAALVALGLLFGGAALVTGRRRVAAR